MLSGHTSVTIITPDMAKGVTFLSSDTTRPLFGSYTTQLTRSQVQKTPGFHGGGMTTI